MPSCEAKLGPPTIILNSKSLSGNIRQRVGRIINVMVNRL